MMLLLCGVALLVVSVALAAAALASTPTNRDPL